MLQFNISKVLNEYFHGNTSKVKLRVENYDSLRGDYHDAVILSGVEGSVFYQKENGFFDFAAYGGFAQNDN